MEASSPPRAAPAAADPAAESDDDGAGLRDRAKEAFASVTASITQRYVQGDRKRDIAKDVVKSTAGATAEASKELAKELTSKREDGVLPRAVSALVEEVEGRGEAIDRMVVVRTPVEEYVGVVMQAVSLGKYREVLKESYYDKMFHLSLLINGRYVLEKNEVITLTDRGGSSRHLIQRGSETMAVKIKQSTTEDGATQQLTFPILLEKTKQHMGPKDFSNYCARSNNCQDFILAVLESNGMAYPHLVAFVKQDSEEIFDNLPKHTSAVAKVATDAAAVSDKLAENLKEEIDSLRESSSCRPCADLLDNFCGK